MQKEIRHFPLVEVRMDSDGEAPMLRGHAAVFDSDSLDLGGFVERIARGTFSGSIQRAAEDPDTTLIHAFWNHDSGIPLGSTRSGKLSLAEDDRGLAFALDPKRLTPQQLDAVQDGDMRMSFGFRTVKDHWEQRDGSTPIRTLLDVELFEVSLVSQPAYPATDVALRSLEQWRAETAPAPEPEPVVPLSVRRRMLDLKHDRAA